MSREAVAVLFVCGFCYFWFVCGVYAYAYGLEVGLELHAPWDTLRPGIEPRGRGRVSLREFELLQEVSVRYVTKSGMWLETEDLRHGNTLAGVLLLRILFVSLVRRLACAF